ncbi:MAG: quinolinate synthase NadA [Desulfovibrionaceae bacterium]|nr:quinolinate synthase NadA [Desulfovibrionaceae bacterium]
MTSLEPEISRLRQDLGPRLIVLGHHYQADAVARHADFLGDSLELARRLSELRAEHIVFCGVWFMAESAAVLCKPEQKVHIPDPGANCSMADMAPARLLEAVLEVLSAKGRRIIPLAYVNSSAGIKALCGRMGGSVCTSANARTMLAWALEQGDGALFLPDQNLALNTARALNLARDRVRVLDVRGSGRRVDLAGAAKADLLVWPGCCSVHHRFKTRHVLSARAGRPGVRVIVHPECRPEVVEASDAAGSTSQIIDYVKQAEPGSTIVIGTETNMVLRLARGHADKTVLPLAESRCQGMARITEAKLAGLLKDLDRDPGVQIPETIAAPARTALERMLDVCRASAGQRKAGT